MGLLREDLIYDWPGGPDPLRAIAILSTSEAVRGVVGGWLPGERPTNRYSIAGDAALLEKYAQHLADTVSRHIHAEALQA